MPVFVKQIESSLLVSSICLAAVVDTNQSSFWPTPDASVKKCAQGLGHGNLRLSLYVPKLKAEKQSILLNFHDRWILSNFWLKSCNVCPKMCRRLAMFAPTCAAGWFFGWLPMAGWVCGWQLCWGSPAFQLGGCGWILHGRRDWLMFGWLSAFILLVGWLLWI